MVRVRQPLAWYQSYYAWTVLGKQRAREVGYRGLGFRVKIRARLRVLGWSEG